MSSETPLTDALDERLADFDWSEGYGNLLDHARKLEKRFTQLEAQLAEARKDSERLDWLLGEKTELAVTPVGQSWIVRKIWAANEKMTWRAAIDAAMKP